jgi:hypothetical protein
MGDRVEVDISAVVCAPDKQSGPCRVEVPLFVEVVRWSRNLGQVLKLGLPWLEDEPDDGQAEAVFG